MKDRDSEELKPSVITQFLKKRPQMTFGPKALVNYEKILNKFTKTLKYVTYYMCHIGEDHFEFVVGKT